MIALDIGGTKVKYGIFDKEPPSFGQFDVSDSNGREAVSESIVAFLKNHNTDCIGISVPGPFDYENGISHMKHKLTSLYGVNLREILENEIPHTKVFFIHDAHAFALGAMEENDKLSKLNFSCLMLGTGVGYINVKNGSVQLNEAKTPKNPLWNSPFKEGIVEDYVSTKALINKAKDAGYLFKDIKTMADHARNGNKDISEIFRHFGETLGECIEAKRREDGFDMLVVGGQISKSFDLMKSGFDKMSGLEVYVVKNPERCALYGLKNF